MGVKYTFRRPPERIAIPQEKIVEIAREVGTYPILVYALLNRGFSEKEIRDVITAEYPGDAIIKTPLTEAEDAADRIIKAVKNNERIGIFADYDCDGVTSGFVMQMGIVALKRALKKSGGVYLHYPQRKDGYGLSNAYCESMKDKLDLVITVDNGIATREQEAILDKYGIDLIVTDHHEPNPATIPMLNKTIIVDPCYSDVSRSYLAGVAVAYNVVRTAARKIGITLNRGIFLPAVMLGTISDCMPMSYENACYIRAGLDFLNSDDKYAKFYLDAFYDSYRKKVALPPVITPKDISFTVAPKVNSASRMGDTRVGAAGLFLGIQGDKKTLDVAKSLAKLNDERKKMTDEIADEVVAKIELPDGQRIVAYDGAAYSKGLLGIVASKITDRFPDYPAFVYKEHGGIVSGSVRCENEGIDCMDMFRQLKDEGIIEMCAGHSSACVIDIRKENLKKFVEMFSKLYDLLEIPEVKKGFDYVLKIKDVTNDLLAAYNKIPFTTQEKPVFIIRDVNVADVQKIGRKKDGVKLLLRDDSLTPNAPSLCVKWWKKAGYYDSIGSPKKVNIVCSIEQDFQETKPCVSLDIIALVPAKKKEDALAA